MGTVTRMELRKIAELHPYANNAKLHPPEQIEKLRASFREFGMIVPVGIDSQDNVIYGHGRLLAAQAEGWDEVPTVTVEDLSETQRQAFVHADNLLGETGYDKEKLKSEALALQAAGFDITLVGFDAAGIQIDGHFWEDVETESTEEYEAFTEKFKPKLTTDDCYTPQHVYEAIKVWAVKRYRLGNAQIVRPFYPGADYTETEYPEGCVVIDNPPFSILSEICRWYTKQGVRFFLFCPGLTCFSIASGEMNYLPIGINIMFDNGADICISFVTNLGKYKIEVAPDLYAAIKAADDITRQQISGGPMPNYEYPPHVCCVQMNKLAKYGQVMRIRACDASFIRALDSQKEQDKAIFGGGFLLSDEAAAEKAAAEKWPLSDRERELIASLGKA